MKWKSVPKMSSETFETLCKCAGLSKSSLSASDSDSTRLQVDLRLFIRWKVVNRLYGIASSYEPISRTERPHWPPWVCFLSFCVVHWLSHQTIFAYRVIWVLAIFVQHRIRLLRWCYLPSHRKTKNAWFDSGNDEMNQDTGTEDPRYTWSLRIGSFQERSAYKEIKGFFPVCSKTICQDRPGDFWLLHHWLNSSERRKQFHYWGTFLCE